MTWPPPNPPTGGKTNVSPQVDDHPDQHNKIAQTVGDITGEVNSLRGRSDKLEDNFVAASAGGTPIVRTLGPTDNLELRHDRAAFSKTRADVSTGWIVGQDSVVYNGLSPEDDRTQSSGSLLLLQAQWQAKRTTRAFFVINALIRWEPRGAGTFTFTIRLAQGAQVLYSPRGVAIYTNSGDIGQFKFTPVTVAFAWDVQEGQTYDLNYHCQANNASLNCVGSTGVVQAVVGH